MIALCVIIGAIGLALFGIQMAKFALSHGDLAPAQPKALKSEPEPARRHQQALATRQSPPQSNMCGSCSMRPVSIPGGICRYCRSAQGSIHAHPVVSHRVILPGPAPPDSCWISCFDAGGLALDVQRAHIDWVDDAGNHHLPRRQEKPPP